jgi:hypothetical protein
VNPARKKEAWAEISRLLREYEDAQAEAIRVEIAKTWEGLRQRLQVVACDAAANDEEGGEPS